MFSNQNSKNSSNVIEERIIPSNIKKPGRKSEAKFESVGFDSFQAINLQTYELNDDKLAETILVGIVDEIRSRASSSSKGSVDSLYQYQNSPNHLNSQLEINASKFSIKDKTEVIDKRSEKTKIFYDQSKQEENNLISITSFNNQRKNFLSTQPIRQPIKNEKMFQFNGDEDEKRNDINRKIVLLKKKTEQKLNKMENNLNNELIESKKEDNEKTIEPTLNQITSKRETKITKKKQNELNQSKGPILNIIQPNSNKLAENDINKDINNDINSTSEYLPILENIQIKATANKQVFPIVTPQNEKNVIQNLSVPENKKKLINDRQDTERKQAKIENIKSKKIKGNYQVPKKVKEKPSKETHRNRNMMQKNSVTANKPKIFNKKPEYIDNDPLPTYENYIKKNKIDFETNDSFIETLSGTSIQDTGSNKSDENYLEDNNENKQLNRGLKITFPMIEEEINQQISSNNKLDSIIENENKKQNYTRNTSENISMDDDLRNMVALESVNNKDLNMEQIIKSNFNDIIDTNEEDSFDVKYETYEIKKDRNNSSKVENTEMIENPKKINNSEKGNFDSQNILNESESLKKTEFKTKFETTKLRDNKNEHKEAEMKKNNSSESENNKEFKAIEIMENKDKSSNESIKKDLNKAGTIETSAAKNFESIKIKDNKNEHKEAEMKKIHSFESKDVKEFKTNEIKENKDKMSNESIKIDLNKAENDEKSEVKDLEVIEIKYNKNEQKKADKKKIHSFESENEFKNIEINEIKNKDRNEIIKIDLNIERDLNEAENDEKSEVVKIIGIKDNKKGEKEVEIEKPHSFENENDKEFKTIRIKENIDSTTNETIEAKVETINEIKVIDDQYNNKIYNIVEDIETKNNKGPEFIEIKANTPNTSDIQNDNEMKIITELKDEARTIEIKDKKVKDFKDAKNFQNLEINLNRVNKAEIIEDKNDENIEIVDDDKKFLKEIETIKITSNLKEKNKFKTNDNYIKNYETNEIESETKINELDTDFETEEIQSNSLNISKTETEISENDHDYLGTENIIVDEIKKLSKKQTEKNNVTIDKKTNLIVSDDIQETESHNNKQKPDKTFRNIFEGKFITNNVFVTKLNRNSSDPYLFSLADDENLNLFDESLISKIQI